MSIRSNIRIYICIICNTSNSKSQKVYSSLNNFSNSLIIKYSSNDFSKTFNYEINNSYNQYIYLHKKIIEYKIFDENKKLIDISTLTLILETVDIKHYVLSIYRTYSVDDRVYKNTSSYTITSFFMRDIWYILTKFIGLQNPIVI